MKKLASLFLAVALCCQAQRLPFTGRVPGMKPGMGARINPGHPLAQNLVGAWIFNDAGFTFHDLAGYNNLTSNAGGVLDNRFQQGINCSGAAAKGAVTTSPGATLKPAEVTFVWYGMILGNATTSSVVAGMTFTNTDTNPFTTYSFGRTNTTTGMNFAYAVSSGQSITFTITQNVPWVLIGTVRDGRQELHGFATGNRIQANAATTAGALNYGANPRFGVGYYVVARDSGSIAFTVLVYNRAIESTQTTGGIYDIAYDLLANRYSFLSPSVPSYFNFNPGLVGVGGIINNPLGTE